jgi:hypothetical protein
MTESPLSLVELTVNPIGGGVGNVIGATAPLLM